MLDIAKDRPREILDVDVYVEKYWESKLKPSFDALWEGCLRRTLDSKKRISEVRKHQREAWTKEPEELRLSIQQECKERNAKALAEWEARFKWTGSPEDYDTYVMKFDRLPQLTFTLLL